MFGEAEKRDVGSWREAALAPDGPLLPAVPESGFSETLLYLSMLTSFHS